MSNPFPLVNIFIFDHTITNTQPLYYYLGDLGREVEELVTVITEQEIEDADDIESGDELTTITKI